MSKFKTVLIIVVSIFFSVAVKGQFRNLESGIDGGFNLSSLRGNIFYESHHDLKTGYSGEVFIQYNLSKTISFRTGVSFETKGVKFDIPSQEQEGTTIYGKDNFDFVEVPFLIKASSGNKIIFSVNAGFYYGYLLRQTETIKPYMGNAETSVDHTNYFKRNEVGVSAGCGIAYPVKQRFIFSLDLRNNFALNDISKVPDYNGGKTKTYSTNFLLGFAFRFG